MRYVSLLSTLFLSCSLLICSACAEVPLTASNGAPSRQSPSPSQQPTPQTKDGQAQKGGADTSRGGRVAMPVIEGCSPNDTNFYMGEVLSFRRDEKVVEIGIRTDWKTTKKLTQPAEEVSKIVYELNGKPMKEDDWKLVETEEGKVRNETRTAVSVCSEDGKDVIKIINWHVSSAGGGTSR